MLLSAVSADGLLPLVTTVEPLNFNVAVFEVSVGLPLSAVTAPRVTLVAKLQLIPIFSDVPVNVPLLDVE